jgi:Fe-S-cluster containining protein
MISTAQLARTTPFSYACHACKRCCHYQVRVNPYDVLTLARHLGTSTTQVKRQYLDEDSTLLRDKGGACVFLNERGCSVHPSRPLACRLYPLSREIKSSGEEYFYPLSPHPLTKGVYGTSGTVDDFLKEQDARAHMQAADRYFQLFQRCVQALGSAPQIKQGHSEIASDYLDADATIKHHRPDIDPASLDAETSMSLHIEAIESFLTRTTHNNPGDIS